MGSAFRLSPYAVVPALAMCVLLVQVHDGVNGGTVKKARKDYWAKNLKTWMNAPLPDIGRADIALKVDPAKHFIASKGTLTFVNGGDSTLARFPLTGAEHWQHLTWTLNGKAYTPETTEHLYVIEPPRPLAPHDSVVVGWSFDGRSGRCDEERREHR